MPLRWVLRIMSWIEVICAAGAGMPEGRCRDRRTTTCATSRCTSVPMSSCGRADCNISSAIFTVCSAAALVPLVVLTSRRDVMGAHVNRRLTTITGGMCLAVIIALNVLLLGQQFHLA